MSGDWSGFVGYSGPLYSPADDQQLTETNHPALDYSSSPHHHHYSNNNNT